MPEDEATPKRTYGERQVARAKEYADAFEAWKRAQWQERKFLVERIAAHIDTFKDDDPQIAYLKAEVVACAEPRVVELGEQTLAMQKRLAELKALGPADYFSE